VAIDRDRVDVDAAAGSRRARATAAALRRLSFNLSGAQLGITVCSLGLGAVAEPVVVHLIEGPFEQCWQCGAPRPPT